LREFGFDLPEVEASLFLEPDKVVRMGVPPLRLKLLTTLSGVEFGECYANRIADVIDDVEVNIISLLDLRRNKAASGRYKDLNDLENLP
jgi:hypothetical protein